MAEVPGQWGKMQMGRGQGKEYHQKVRHTQGQWRVRKVKCQGKGGVQQKGRVCKHRHSKARARGPSPAQARGGQQKCQTQPHVRHYKATR